MRCFGWIVDLPLHARTVGFPPISKRPLTFNIKLYQFSPFSERKRVHDAVKKLIIQEHARFQRCWACVVHFILLNGWAKVQLPDLVIRQAEFRCRPLTNGTSSSDFDQEFTSMAFAEETAIFPTGKNMLSANLKHARIVCCCTRDHELRSIVTRVGEKHTFGCGGDKHNHS